MDIFRCLEPRANLDNWTKYTLAEKVLKQVILPTKRGIFWAEGYGSLVHPSVRAFFIDFSAWLSSLSLHILTVSMAVSTLNHNLAFTCPSFLLDWPQSRSCSWIERVSCVYLQYDRRQLQRRVQYRLHADFYATIIVTLIQWEIVFQTRFSLIMTHTEI